MRSRFVFLPVLLTLVLVLAAGTASAKFNFNFGRGIKGSGDMETRELDLKDFTRIDVGGAFDLEISFGDRQKLISRSKAPPTWRSASETGRRS